jgi:hypothetical protein
MPHGRCVILLNNYMSERVPRMAPINNQGDGEVYTQYRQWPFNSTNMGSNKSEGTNGQPANAYPGDEDAEDIGDNIMIGTPDEFKRSRIKRGVLLRNNKIIWDTYGAYHGRLHRAYQQKYNKKPLTYDYYNLRVKGDQVHPIRYQKVKPFKSIALSTDEINSLQKLLPQFEVVKGFRKEIEDTNKKLIPSFMDFYRFGKKKFRDLFTQGKEGDEEEPK